MFFSKVKRLWEKDFSHYVMILTSGTVLAQLIPVLISPILTRLYSPSEFALLAFYLAVANFFTVIATLRFEQAILLPKDDEDALSIVALCMMIMACMALLSFVLFMLWKDEVAHLLGHAESAAWLMLIPLSVLATGLYRTLINWSNRHKHYKQMAATKVLQTGVTATSNISTGSFSVHGGLIIGEILGHLCAAVLLLFRGRTELMRMFTFSWQCICRNATKYADFAKVNTPHVLVDTLQSSGIVFLLVSFFGDVVLGMYALMLRVLMAPVGMLGTSVAQVFFKQASDIYNQGGDVGRLMRVITYKLALFSWPCFALFAFFSPTVFAFVFGDEWRKAGEYAQILMPWIAVHFVVMPVMQLPMIFNKQRVAFVFGLVGNALMFGAIWYGGYIGDVETGFLLLSLLMVAYFLALYLWLRTLCKFKPLRIQEL